MPERRETVQECSSHSAWSAAGDQTTRQAPSGKDEALHVAMNPSVRMIVELNIVHFRALLTREQEARKRETILRLLQEEEQKLQALTNKDIG